MNKLEQFAKDFENQREFYTEEVWNQAIDRRIDKLMKQMKEFVTNNANSGHPWSDFNFAKLHHKLQLYHAYMTEEQQLAVDRFLEVFNEKADITEN